MNPPERWRRLYNEFEYLVNHGDQWPDHPDDKRHILHVLMEMTELMAESPLDYPPSKAIYGVDSKVKRVWP